MKFKTTAKAVKANYDCISVSYCGLQSILRATDPAAYTCGVYGWNADIYPVGYGKAIVTGYRPFGRAPRLSYDELRAYERRADAIWGWDNKDPYELKRAKVDELLAELAKLI